MSVTVSSQVVLTVLAVLSRTVAGGVGTETISISSSQPNAPAGDQTKIFIEPFLPQEAIQVQSIHYGDAQGAGSHGWARPSGPVKKPRESLLSHNNIALLLVEIFGTAVVPIILLPVFGLGLLYLIWLGWGRTGHYGHQDPNPYAFDSGNTYGTGEHSQVIGYDYGGGSQLEKKMGLEKKRAELTARILRHL